ncbi:uncharacterized protein BX663DRAFT_430292 [Cokeromyces recurvatus]|uniref:uncharacterized protein n=1 Tax=Cokeromyces recurvatus TaxID=90255 RepID=UPI00221E5A3D|nr:uncharacterized protein BX663DRAFT_430292 [Cokeromyces recurvatus]KAI7905164.1 hypothetical protein BX663DRAFT_430292 [Cokeromyces recurvatus]
MATSESNETVTTDSKSKNNVNNKETVKPATPQNASTIPESAPTSPSYPPFNTAYIDPVQFAAAAAAAANGYDVSDSVNYAATYVYPLSPQFSVQYYPDYSNGYQSYPGSPSLHPQSPTINPTSPPFSPTTGYHQYPHNIAALSPPTHAYVLPSHHHTTQPYPPLHISSPVLTSTNSIPGSPPHQYLPGPYIIQTTTTAPTDNRNNYYHKRNYQHYIHPEQQSVDSDLNSFHTHNIYVRGLSASTTDESFLEMCQVYGKIASSKAIIDQKTGECKGYGFAMFENEHECEEAIEGLNKAGLQASFARVGQESFSSKLKNLQDESSTNIYISNLPLDMTEQKLEELFEPYQTVSNRILRDPQTGLSRGVGFARLTDREAASAVIEKFNGQTIEGSSAPLQVRFADSPAQKKLKNQTARRRMVRPHEYQSMAATFAIRPIMPITPETMLGIAPANSMHHPYYQSQ